MGVESVGVEFPYSKSYLRHILKTESIWCRCQSASTGASVTNTTTATHWTETTGNQLPYLCVLVSCFIWPKNNFIPLSADHLDLFKFVASSSLVEVSNTQMWQPPGQFVASSLAPEKLNQRNVGYNPYGATGPTEWARARGWSEQVGYVLAPKSHTLRQSYV